MLLRSPRGLSSSRVVEQPNVGALRPAGVNGRMGNAFCGGALQCGKNTASQQCKRAGRPPCRRSAPDVGPPRSTAAPAVAQPTCPPTNTCTQTPPSACTRPPGIILVTLGDSRGHAAPPASPPGPSFLDTTNATLLAAAGATAGAGPGPLLQADGGGGGGGTGGGSMPLLGDALTLLAAALYAAYTVVMKRLLVKVRGYQAMSVY